MGSHTVTMSIGRAVIRLLLLVATALTLGCGLVVVQAQQRTIHRADAIVIVCSPDLAKSANRAHIEYAFNLYNQGYALRIIVVGVGDSPRLVRDMLVERKVPEQAIFTVEGSHSQHKTIRSVALLAHRQRMYSLLLVDTPEAMLGNLKMARDLGMVVYAAPLPSATLTPGAIVQASLNYWGYVLFSRG